MSISQTTPDEQPPMLPPCRWPALITSPTLAKFHLVWRCLWDVVLFCSSCLFEHTLAAVCALPEYQSCRKYNVYSTIFDDLNVRHIFDQIDLYPFEVRLELYRANARIVIMPPSLSFSPPDAPAKPLATSHHFTPPRQVSARLAPLVSSPAMFLPPRWSETPVSAVSSMCEMYRRSKGLISLNMKIKSSIIFADTVDALTATFAV